jgi:signal transduction histidine kinase/CheY-like chemotaxis protein/transcriptional regulator with GAF, ATPase, and Fis domain
MDKNNKVDPEVVLREWRTKILNGFLMIVAVAAAAMLVVNIADAISRPGQWPAVIIFSILELILVALAVFRRIDYRIRAWGVLLVPYAVGLTTLASYGLGSSGRLYLLVLPIGALILIGARPGILASVVSILTVLVFAFLADRGTLMNWLITDRNSLLMTDWLAEFVDTAMLLATVMALLIMFYRFQERLIDKERCTQAELLRAQKQLEEQNATLEQKVQERTVELRAANHSLEQHNAALATLNRVSEAMTKTLDVKTLTRLVGDQMRAIFDVDSSLIMLLDSQTNLIHVPYEYDRNEGGYIDYVEPFPLGTGLSSKVITTGQPLMAGTLEEEVANGAYFPPEIIEKGSGFYSQSWLGVPIMASDQVLGLVALAHGRPHVFNQNHMRLLQTLSSNVGAAIENARLFVETQRLLKETEQRAAELATVNTVSSALISELDLGALIHLVGEQTRSVFKADIVYVALLDEASGMISFPYTFGEELAPIKYGEGLTSRIIETNRPLLINQELNLQMVEIGAAVIGRQSMSFLGVPIFVSGDAIGVLSVQSTTQEGLFTENDQHLLSTIAANVGIALQNARLFDEVKRQEQFSAETKRRLADIIDFLPDATMVIDQAGKIMAWNRALEEMTGIAADEMLGKGDYEYALPFYGERRPILIDLVLLPREDIKKKYSHIQWTRGILTGEAYTPALKDGARYLYATASALYDAQGSLVGAIETIRDITDRKHTEEELKKARASAEQANHAKSAFLANMSHELRTPLNSIIGFTRIVCRKSEGVLPEKQTENLDKVLTSAEHLLNLINTILDIAKIEAGRMDVLAARFRIGALIDLCANTAQPLLRSTVMLEKRVDEELNIIDSDQDKVRQIVLNLLSNAAKFTHEGRILLSAKRTGDNLCISVADTGIGISEESLPRIFKEFQQADTSTTRQYGGTGLGLSISRNLARLLGGDLTVQSELGKGSTFTLVIPIHYRSKSLPVSNGSLRLLLDREPASVEEPTPPPRAGSVKKRILVIDDDPDAVYLLQENLSQQEFEIIGARNGQDGIHLARVGKPQAILLDIVMPGADGWQVLHDLKADPATSNIPVVFLTIVDKKALGLQLGAAAYLLKPLDPVEVRDALDRVIGDAPARKKHVLVVDDDPNIVDMLRQFLPESNFSLESAQDGVEGLQAVEVNCPDIILLDIIMPRLDGFGVVERLRANPQTRDIPIIVISARELTASESRRLRESVAVVMRKQGFEGERLVAEINNVLKQERLST